MSFKRVAVLLLKYGLLGLALLATAGISAITTMRVVLTSQEVTVPTLVEKRIPEAGALAARQGLLLRVEGRRNDPRVPADRIMSQEPEGGTTLKTQRTIRVWVSLGPRRLTVPPVEGESLRTGRLSLEQAQVPVGRVVEVSDGAAEGTILQQHPAPGETESLSGDGASLLVSVGPRNRNYVMPDLIGKRAGEVLDALRLAGLKVAEVRYRTYPGVGQGIVLKQVPAAGHKVSPQTSIALEISKVEP